VPATARPFIQHRGQQRVEFHLCPRLQLFQRGDQYGPFPASPLHGGEMCVARESSRHTVIALALSVLGKRLLPLLAIGNFRERFSLLLALTLYLIFGIANGQHGENFHFGGNAEERFDLIETAEAHPV